MTSSRQLLKSLPFALAAVLAIAPACTRIKPEPAATPTTTLTANPEATETPAVDFTDAPTTPSSASVTPDRAFISTPRPLVATPRVPLPTASFPSLIVSTPAVPGTPAPAPVLTPRPNFPTPNKLKTVVDTASGLADLVTFNAAIAAAGLTSTLKDTGPFTLFAPSKAAFEKLPAGTLDALLKPENKGRLTKILQYHIVPGNFDTTRLRSGTLPTQEGLNLTANVVTGQPVRINGALVLTADHTADNGVIHVIDQVLMPADLAPEADTLVALTRLRPELTTLVEAIEISGLRVDLEKPGPFTLFAPNNAAFDKLPAGKLAALKVPANKAKLEELLRYHITNGKTMSFSLKDGGITSLQGSGIAIQITGQPTPRVAGASITLPDSLAGNGVMHVIDAVMIPPGYGLP